MFSHLGSNGRHSKLSKKVADTIFKENYKNSTLSTRKMSVLVMKKCGIKVSHSSIKNHLNSTIFFFSFKKREKPELQPRHVQARFEANKRWIAMAIEMVKTLIFSDESKFCRLNMDNNKQVWRKPGTGLEPKHLFKTRKFGGGSVMVWGCFGYLGKLEFIESTMKAEDYVDILSRKPMTSAAELGLDKFIFVQDNDPKHTSKLTRNFLKAHEIETLDWPAQSPDCNPIENLWGLLRVKLVKKGLIM